MKGKSYFATEHKAQEDYENIKSLSAYPIGKDGKVNTRTAYTIVNLITVPGKQVFVLLNPFTGKYKRTKHIFVEYA